jgi:ectoine hydroxylase-related dioxygenase (phytanoyl-CoA dioxygenase family)
MEANMTNATTLISEAQKQQFKDEGYFILEKALDDSQLKLLQDTCQHFIDEMNAEMDRLGVTVLRGINHKNNRYFIPTFLHGSDLLAPILFSEQMAEINRATLGDTSYLFLDQYVVKAPEKGLKFSWHQDSGYIGYEHRPYLTCWCALDDMNEENGTIYVLPYSRAGTKEVLPHETDNKINDKVGYFGDDPGIPVIVPAGSIAVFSSTLLHRSGFNTTDRFRRAWIAQYSAEPIYKKDSTEILYSAEPFLKDGQRVRTA